MSDFTPISALAGGLLIGTGATLLLWLNGRIAGVSNIASGLLSWKRGDALWRVVFLGGLIIGAYTCNRIIGTAPVARAGFPPALLAAGGLLVGYGTSLGSGCTSGHGVCGLGRLSPRSLVATIVFLIAGIATATIVRQVFGIR